MWHYIHLGNWSAWGVTTRCLCRLLYRHFEASFKVENKKIYVHWYSGLSAFHRQFFSKNYYIFWLLVIELLKDQVNRSFRCCWQIRPNFALAQNPTLHAPVGCVSCFVCSLRRFTDQRERNNRSMINVTKQSWKLKIRVGLLTMTRLDWNTRNYKITRRMHIKWTTCKTNKLKSIW